MKKTIVFGSLTLLAVGAISYGYVFAEKRYEGNYSLGPQLLDNCTTNLKTMTRTPSSFEVNEAKIYIGGPYFEDDKNAYLGSSEYLQQFVDEGAEFLPLNVHVEAEASNSYGASMAVNGTCRYASIRFDDGEVNAIAAMAFGIGDNVVRNPRVYDVGMERWFAIESDIKNELDLKKMFSNRHSKVSTRSLTNQPL